MIQTLLLLVKLDFQFAMAIKPSSLKGSDILCGMSFMKTNSIVVDPEFNQIRIDNESFLHPE